MKLIILAITTIVRLATAIPTVSAVPVTLEQRGYDCAKKEPCHPECKRETYDMWECTCMLTDCLRDSYHYRDRERDLVSCICEVIHDSTLTILCRRTAVPSMARRWASGDLKYLERLL
jgi:hypothetical protein